MNIQQTIFSLKSPENKNIKPQGEEKRMEERKKSLVKCLGTLSPRHYQVALETSSQSPRHFQSGSISRPQKLINKQYCYQLINQCVDRSIN